MIISAITHFNFSEVENGHESATSATVDDYDFAANDKKTSVTSSTATTARSRIKRQSNRAKKKDDGGNNQDSDYDYNDYQQYGGRTNGSDSGNGRKQSLPTDPEVS